MTIALQRDEIFERIREQLARPGVLPIGFQSGLKMEWLPGDASNRYYGRLRSPSGESLVVMVMNAPEAFKSEEVTGADEKKITELPFVTIGRKLFSEKILVPQIVYVDPRSEFLVLDDLGDELLYDRRQKGPALDLYKEALSILARFQKIQPFEPAASRRFTTELLDWEAEHFVEYALVKNNKNASEAMLKEIRSFLTKAVREIAAEPYVLSHRDYHSKNLMIDKSSGKIALIDFQDALLGPADYDLASLLRDSYVTFSDEEESNLLQHYERESGRRVNPRIFGLVSVQRNLKAVGRFFYISKVKGRDTHLPYVVPTLRRVLKTLRQMNEIRFLTLIEGIFVHELKV